MNEVPHGETASQIDALLKKPLTRRDVLRGAAALGASLLIGKSDSHQEAGAEVRRFEAGEVLVEQNNWHISIANYDEALERSRSGNGVRLQFKGSVDDSESNFLGFHNGRTTPREGVTTIRALPTGELSQVTLLIQSFDGNNPSGDWRSDSHDRRTGRRAAREAPGE